MNGSNRDLDPTGPDFSKDLREAVEALTRAEKAAPLEMQVGASQAEKLVVRMRNELIDQLRLVPPDQSGTGLRKEPGSREAEHWKGLLTQLNGILSLIVGIEYPSSFVRREIITQARDLLQGLLTQDG